ncbi:unnamed protein product (macronuclear) [Paramecium tetraurelia]|uniref:G-protein coupled receptors family 1 profile domain-containing protein n=1 Tax=Paramecium tetraurelia TaxID=5888 RepID=A0BVA4_PARTE|nr:uncharacterized protein GSPATT00005717001 [Paramecium tetraurelia]CAK62471.1 unnamed protein product [Paramecium tetraurelia]|eukprot:XP_001429869.1 hypothetical protein (macronuclear) [Paramecium tetraurelia strain d4-2]
MQLSENLIARVFVIILCLLSMTGCSLILWTFFRTPRLNKNPGSIIQRMTIAQIIITFLMLFAQFYISFDDHPTGGAFVISQQFCSFLGFIEIFFSSQYSLYNIYFPINLYCSLKTQDYNFNKYFKFMEISSLIFSFLFTLTMFFVQDVKINVVGVCGLMMVNFSTSFSAILVIITLSILILLVFIINEKSSFKTTLYNKDSEKFHQKYHKEFIIVNTLYTSVFLGTYMIPSCLIFWGQLIFNDDTHFYSFPIIYPLGGILLFFIRINDPIVKKYIYTMIMGKKKKNQNCKLKDKLLQKEDYNGIEQMSMDSGLEISVCNNKKLRYTVRAVPNDKQVQPDITVSSVFGSQIKLIKNNQELFIVLLSIKNAINHCIEEKQALLKSLKPFNFTHITKYSLYLQDDFKDLDQKYKNYNNLCLKDYVNNICYKRVINCYSYASKTLIHLFSQVLNIDLNQLKSSLRIEQNTKKIVNSKLPQSYGPIFLTYDNYFSIEIISKQHKLLLTKGGGLMNICKRYQTEYSRQKNGNTLLPAILGLYTIQIDEDRYINIVLKLNQIKINYPLQVNHFNIQVEQDQLIQQDVFGWIQLSLEKGQFKLFIAEKLFDDKFQIKIEDNDFKLSQNAAKDLVSILSKDIEEFCFCRNVTISLVYFKLPTNRLDSMCKHENSLSYHYQIYKNSQQITPLQMNEYFKDLGQFELDSKIGFVRIYFDNFWQEWEYINENERCLYFDKLVEQLSEVI